MEITYDTKADALYIHLTDGEFGSNREIQEGIILDLDTEGCLLGLEILNASRWISLANLTTVSIKMPLELAEALEATS
jgi:uncharacterized protein YuzE